MEQSRIKNSGKNLIYATVFQIVKILLVFVARIIFVKKLGAEYLGVNGLFTNVLSVLSLADLGLVTVLMYSLYKPLAENDEEKILQYINYFKRVYYIIALIIFVIGIILIPFLKYLVNLPGEMEHIYTYYVLLLMNSVMTYLFIYKTTLLSADQKMYVINKIDTIIQFLLFFLQTLILLLTSNFTLYLVVNIICTLLGNILKAKKVNELYPYLKSNKNVKLKKEEKKKIFSNLYSLFFYKIGTVIQTNTDNILISVFVGTITVGYYSNYSTIILSVTTFLNMIFTSIKASVGNFVYSKNKEEQVKMFNLLEDITFWIVSFCSICFIVLIPDFIEICFGKEYVLSYGLLICAVLSFYTSNIRQALWIYRETTGMFNRTKHITIVTSLINIILSVIGGYLWGITGIVGATVLSRMIYAWWREPLIIYKEYFNTSSKDYFINYIKRVILTTIIYFVVNFIISLIPNINTYILFVLKVCIAVVITLLSFILVYRKSESYGYIKENILKKYLNKILSRN